MSRRTHALLAIVSFITFCVCIVLANNFYWGYGPSSASGEYYLFKRTLPTILGQVLWLVLKPLLLLSPLATAWFLYRYFRTAPRAGFCPHCGYDLRASQDRCPECGRPIPPVKS